VSRQNVDQVRRAYAAFASGDRDAVMEMLTPDVVWYPALELLLDQSIYHGPEAVCRLLFEEIPAVLEGFRAELLELHDLDDERVLAVARFRGRAGGTDVEQTFGQLFHGRDGRTYRMDSYPSRREALEAIGLTA
jgi:ketosteroid isomerase-like protein